MGSLLSYRMFVVVLLLWSAGCFSVQAQQSPYAEYPEAKAPYYRVRYEASAEPDGLIFPVNYALWVPPGVSRLRGVVVHQHGCGEGSCRSGLTGAWDLHWQALAKAHDCALLSPAYEQPEGADCQRWCDPRNGSAAAFLRALHDLGAASGHPELSEVPWALWGHSGGGHWAGGMVLLYPERVAAAWLRSGVPLLEADPGRVGVRAHQLSEGALQVPLMCNLGTQEGVTVKDGRFAGVWPANETFFRAVRGRGGLIAVAVDPLSSHDCGNQRYLAIPWLDDCLRQRLPSAGEAGVGLRSLESAAAWLAPVSGGTAVVAEGFSGNVRELGWLPSEQTARRWEQYVRDTKVEDATAAPQPVNLRVRGNELTWECEADLESGLAGFVIERDGQELVRLPEQGKNPFGRVLFQNLQYSDTPTMPLVPMRYVDRTAEVGRRYEYRVRAVNTAERI